MLYEDELLGEKKKVHLLAFGVSWSLPSPQHSLMISQAASTYQLHVRPCSSVWE